MTLPLRNSGTEGKEQQPTESTHIIAEQVYGPDNIYRCLQFEPWF